ncbi:MAG TPA: non-ribosomal peptide synthetase, partial [Vicinamibacterales bacterium]|nr:non-ribosomal peptide synthetase [Vicinamibacterales bacterium]
PKGALNTHRGLANRLAWMQRAYRLDGSDAVLQKTPFSFDVSVWEFFWPLMTGARLVLCRPGGHQDPSHLAALIREQSITTLHFVPSMLRVFLDQPALPALPSLRRVICSGEALSRDVERSFVERFDCELHNLYGPTEASIDVTAWRASRDDGHATVPLGRPIANTRIYVVDRSLRQCPVGVPGELCIAGVQVGRGYHRRPALTAERFVPDPFAADGTRMYRSGDRARWLADGVLEYLGRLDDQVKVRGVRIELGEIEARLRAHPRVREAAVVAAPAPGGGVRLIAYGVPSGAPSSDTEIRRFVHEALPETMVPSRFVWLDALPLSPNGKLDRKALPALDAERPRIDAEFTAPGSQTENAVAAIWREILDVPAVGVHDNFFELGGHSLMLARVHGRLVSRLSVTLTMVDLFRCPTVRLLAEAIDRSHAEPAPAAETSRADARQDRSMLLAARRGSRLQHRREVDR